MRHVPGRVERRGTAGRKVADRVGPQWLLGVYFLFTVGELCLSPIGLSLVNKLAPARIASLMMALWFMCTAGANYLAAMLDSLVAEDDPIHSGSS